MQIYISIVKFDFFKLVTENIWIIAKNDSIYVPI